MRARGHRVTVVDFEKEPDARPEPEHFDALIVLGGPMNVEEAGKRVHLQTEIAAIGTALAHNQPVLGICLGAQLLAHALGARVYRSPVSEIGWYDLALTEQGLADPVLSPLGRSASVFQWHGFTFDIPAGATHLARSSACANQAFRYGRNAYGLQFHLEMDAALIEHWLSLPDYREDLIAARVGNDAASILDDSKKHIAALQNAAHLVFGKFLDLVDR